MAHEIKDNGLPKGQGLYWKDKEKRDQIWLVISHKGKVSRHPSGTTNWKEAIGERDRIKADIVKGDTAHGPRRIVKVDELLDDYLKHLSRRDAKRGAYSSNNSRKTGYTVNKHIRPFWGKMKANKIEWTPRWNEYIDERIAEYRAEGMEEGSWIVSINRELSYLRAAMNLGYNAHPRKVSFVPKNWPIDSKAEKLRAHTGILNHGQYELLLSHLADHMKPVLPFVMYCGVRGKELKFIRREQVDWEIMTIHLRAGETKDGPARDVPIVDIAIEPLKKWIKFTEDFYPKCQWLFHYNGKRINEWRTAWDNACRRAGLQRPRLNSDGTPKLHKRGKKKGQPIMENLVKFHDTRRTAITVHGRAKVSESDSMRTTGHKTIEVHRRYDQDKDAAVRTREAVNNYLNEKHYSTPQVRESKVESIIDVAAIERIAALREKGLLTEEQYNAAIARLLG